MFDAYTVKKVLPRLVIAAVLIQLSWDLFTGLIDVVNSIAWGIEGLLYIPFGGRDGVDISNLTFAQAPGGDVFGTGLVAGLAGVIIGTAALGIVGLLSLAVSIFLALIIAFAVLALRVIVLTALLVISPIALLAWILPNTDGFWKLWWETFSKLLLMYPLILLIIAAGRVFAAIASGTQGGGGPLLDGSGTEWIVSVIVIIAYFGPFFLIPKTFQMAGSTFANITGMINDRGRGVFDRLKKGRLERVGRNIAKTKNYQRWSDKKALGRGMNRLTGAAINPRDLKGGRGTIMAGVQRGRALQGQENLKEDATFQANQNDDKFLLALANKDLAAQKAKAAEQKWQEEVNAGQADSDAAIQARRSMDAYNGAIASASLVKTGNQSSTRLAALNALAKTGYQFETGEQGYRELADTVHSITGEDQAAYSNAMNEAQFHLKNAGRFDLGGINDGAGYEYVRGVDKANGYSAGNAKPNTHIAGAQHLVGPGYSKNGVVKTESGDEFALGDVLAQRVASGAASTDKVVEHHARLLDALPGATGANKKEIQAQLAAIESLQSVRVPQSDPNGYANIMGASQGINENKARLRQNIDPSIIENEINK